MLTVLCGDDYHSKAVRRTALLGNVTHHLISPENFSVGEVLEQAKSTGLFDEPQVLVLSDIFSLDEAKPLLKELDAMQESRSHFIFSETKLLKKDLKLFEKAGATIEQFVLPKNSKKQETFNMFSLSDALGARDKKKLWITYQQARRANVSPEEIHSILWWQTKNMLMVAREQKNPGLHPFVYDKTTKALSKYPNGATQKLANTLVSAFNNSRRGQANLDHALEKMILAL